MEEDIVSDEAVGADFEETMEFVERSQIDAVAPAIGTAHGIYHGVPKINFELVEKLGKEKTPVVIHGGSGLSCRNIYPSYRTWRKKGKHFYISKECVP